MRLALDSKCRTVALKLWRAVEAQHVVSTLRLVDHDPAAQALLEQILDESKPPQPESTNGLHYLLATPFRYAAPRGGSRFRAEDDPGVLYAAGERRTACAEAGYWRWRFVADSAGLRELPATAQTLFQLGARGATIDLREPPFARQRRSWTDPVSYAQTQAFARAARGEGVEVIRYESARDPARGACAAILQPAAIAPRRPTASETWYLTVTRTGVVWQRAGEHLSFAYTSPDAR